MLQLVWRSFAFLRCSTEFAMFPKFWSRLLLSPQLSDLENGLKNFHFKYDQPYSSRTCICLAREVLTFWRRSCKIAMSCSSFSFSVCSSLIVFETSSRLRFKSSMHFTSSLLYVWRAAPCSAIFDLKEKCWSFRSTKLAEPIKFQSEMEIEVRIECVTGLDCQIKCWSCSMSSFLT